MGTEEYKEARDRFTFREESDDVELEEESEEESEDESEEIKDISKELE